MSDEHYTMGDRMLSEVYLNAIKTCEELEKIQDNKIKKLEKKLEIATKALKEYAEEGNWDDIRSYNFSIDDTYFVEKAEFKEKGYEPARKALKEMEGVK